MKKNNNKLAYCVHYYQSVMRQNLELQIVVLFTPSIEMKAKHRNSKKKQKRNPEQHICLSLCIKHRDTFASILLK